MKEPSKKKSVNYNMGIVAIKFAKASEEEHNTEINKNGM